MDGCMNKWIDGWLDGWIDGYLARCIDGWVHACKDKKECVVFFFFCYPDMFNKHNWHDILMADKNRKVFVLFFCLLLKN